MLPSTAVFILLFAPCIVFSTGNQLPNLILLYADDLGWDDVGYHGSQQVLTPNIDKLASEAVVLDNYYTSPLCSPSRGAILTGVHPINSTLQHGVFKTSEDRGLPLHLKLLPQHLAPLGYKSHLVGKWHLGFSRPQYTPTRRGFDSHFGFWFGRIGYYDHAIGDDHCHESGLDFRDGMDLATNVTGRYTTDLFTERAEKIIQQHDQENPLFLMMSYQSVHTGNVTTPLEAPDELVQKFSFIQDERRQKLAATLFSMDMSIGKVMGSLKEHGLLDSSIVIFASDNGAAVVGTEGSYGSNWPLRGSKFSLWDGGMRVPAFVWSPRHLKPRVSRELFHVTDWLPTIMSALESNLGTGHPIDGPSHWDMLAHGKPSPRREILHNIDPIDHTAAIRVGRFKLVQGNVGRGVDGWYPIPDGRHNETTFVSTQLVCPAISPLDCSTSKELCLFDMQHDPCERRNIAAEHKDIVHDLWNKIRAFKKTARFGAPAIIDLRSCPSRHGGAWSTWLPDEQKSAVHRL